MKKKALITLLIGCICLFNGCKEVISKKNNLNKSPVKSEDVRKSKLDSPKELLIEAQKYYDNKDYSKSLAILVELEERFPESKECMNGITIEGISNNTKRASTREPRTEITNTYNHILALEISANNIDEEIIDDRVCKTKIWLEKGNIVVSGYLTEKTYYKIISTGTLLESKYYDVKTNLKESTFLFDDKSNTVVWTRVRYDNSGINVFFENK